jgi:hypothetical protein
MGYKKKPASQKKKRRARGRLEGAPKTQLSRKKEKQAAVDMMQI